MGSVPSPQKSIFSETRHTFQDSSGKNVEASRVPLDDNIHFVNYLQHEDSLTLAGESLTEAHQFPSNAQIDTDRRELECAFLVHSR